VLVLSVPPVVVWPNAAGAAHNETAIVVTRANARKVESSFVGLRG
jgi:hypothetical protein